LKRRCLSHEREFCFGLIFGFSWSRDGKEMLLARGENASDVILISNFR